VPIPVLIRKILHVMLYIFDDTQYQVNRIVNRFVSKTEQIRFGILHAIACATSSVRRARQRRRRSRNNKNAHALFYDSRRSTPSLRKTFYFWRPPNLTDLLRIRDRKPSDRSPHTPVLCVNVYALF